MKMRFSLFIYLFSLMSIPTWSQNPSHPFSVQDMVVMQRLSNPSPSPDGKSVAYTRWEFDLDANKGSTNLWLVSIDGKSDSQLTHDKYKSNTSPVWSPNGSTIAFISNQSGSNQIWMMDVLTKKSYQLSRFPVDVGNIRFSPTGKHIAFSAEVYPQFKTLEESAKKDLQLSKNPANALIFDQLMVRHWDS